MISKSLVSKIIDAVKDTGLGEDDINNAKMLLMNNEHGLAFDTILTQLYEYEVEIDAEFYDLVVQAARKMKLFEDDYLFIKELVRVNTDSQTNKG